MNMDPVAEMNDAQAVYGGCDNGEDTVYSGIWVVSLLIGGIIGLVMAVVSAISNSHF